MAKKRPMPNREKRKSNLVRMKVDGKMASVVGMADLLPGAKTLPLDEAPYAIVSWDDGSVAYLSKKVGAKNLGGPGSGHHGHEGRPGKRGGSKPGRGGGSKKGQSLLV